MYWLSGDWMKMRMRKCSDMSFPNMLQSRFNKIFVQINLSFLLRAGFVLDCFAIYVLKNVVLSITGSTSR